MARPKRLLPSPDSMIGLILIITALSGELPSNLVYRLPVSETYMEKMIKIIKKKKLLRTYYGDGLRGLRLTSTAKKRLLESQPDRYTAIFLGETTTNSPKYTLPKRLRLHRMAEVLVTMYNAGILSLPWEKPDIFRPTPLPTAPYIDQPLYYSAREFKLIGVQATKIRNSRATGILLSEGSIYAVYNTASSQMKWENRAEERLKTFVQMELCWKRLSGQFMDASLNAIIFGQGMDQLGDLMGCANRKTGNYIATNGSFPHFHYLTNDHRGEFLLQLLCDPELKSELDDILSEGMEERRPGFPIEHDAIDESGAPVLFGYTCDMPRIRRFDTALGLHKQNGTLFCFDFQEEMLRQVCGQRVVFQVIDFEVCKRSVIREPEEMD